MANQDFKEFFALLNDRKVEFLLIEEREGGFTLYGLGAGLRVGAGLGF